MKFLITLLALLTNATSYGAVECSAPESVIQVAKQIALTFDGSTISCDDDSQFTSKFIFECKGDKFYNIKDANDLTTRPDGSKVYVISVLSEQNEQTIMTEQVYSDFSAYQADETPLETSKT